MRRAFGILGGAGVGLGCAAMVSMLPGAAASVLSIVGITGSSGLAIALAGVAEPLFIASAVLVLISALACSRLVTALSGTAVVLLYLSMFGLAHGANGATSSMSIMAMNHTHPTSSAHTNAPLFYLGVVMMITSAGLASWRRHRRRCQPLLQIRLLRTVGR